MRTRARLAAASVVLLAAGCGQPEGVADPPTQDASTVEEAETADTCESGSAPDMTEPANAGAVTVPQTCGTVTSVTGEELTVEIVAGDLDCPSASDRQGRCLRLWRPDHHARVRPGSP